MRRRATRDEKQQALDNLKAKTRERYAIEDEITNRLTALENSAGCVALANGGKCS